VEEALTLALAGDGKAIILQNHGLLTVRGCPRPHINARANGEMQVGQTIDAAAFWFLSLDKTCHAQLLVDAAANGSGHKKTFIPEEEARFSYEQVGTPEKGWLAVSFPSYLLST
jgi:hypothetical protein